MARYEITFRCPRCRRESVMKIEKRPPPLPMMGNWLCSECPEPLETLEIISALELKPN